VLDAQGNTLRSGRDFQMSFLTTEPSAQIDDLFSNAADYYVANGPPKSPAVLESVATTLRAADRAAEAEALIDAAMTTYGADAELGPPLHLYHGLLLRVRGDLAGGLAEIAATYPKLTFAEGDAGTGPKGSIAPIRLSADGKELGTFSSDIDIATALAGLGFVAKRGAALPKAQDVTAHEVCDFLAFAVMLGDAELAKAGIERVGDGTGLAAEDYGRAAFLMGVARALTEDKPDGAQQQLLVAADFAAGEPFGPDAMAWVITTAPTPGSANQAREKLAEIFGKRVPERLTKRVGP
jgi:hypothetical protein